MRWPSGALLSALALVIAFARAESVVAAATAAPDLVLWDFVADQKVFPLCSGILAELGPKKLGDPNAAHAACVARTTPLAPSAALVEPHCRYFAVQLEQAFAQRGGIVQPVDFCGVTLQYHSYKLKHDLLGYFTQRELWNVCTDSINTAITQAAGATGPTSAVQSNIGIGCKMELEKHFKQYGMPFQIASVGCKGFVKKALLAITGGELDPKDSGKQFCDGRSMQASAFATSAPSPMPTGFPITKEAGPPRVTIHNLRKMVRSAFENPREAFNKYDSNGDGVLSQEEWEKMCGRLGIPKWDCKRLFEELDADDSGSLSEAEWQDALGVTLKELARYIQDAYGNSHEGWKAADGAGGDASVHPSEVKDFVRPALAKWGNAAEASKATDTNGDGAISVEELQAMMKKLGLTPAQIQDLTGKIMKHDADGDGKLTGPQFRKVLRAQGPRLAGSASHDGKLDPAEFESHCASVGVTPRNARRLFPEVDTDGDGRISEEEYKGAFGIDQAELKRRMRSKWGTPEASFEAMDADGDGEISRAEFEAGCEKLGIPKARAKELFDELDVDYSGSISPEEWDEAFGLTKEDAKSIITDKLGKPSDAFEKLDKDGDGKVSAEDVEEALKDAGVSAEEAAEIAKELDADGKGVSKDDWLDATGAKDLAKERYAEEPKRLDAPKLTPEDMRERLNDAFKSGKDVWEKVGGDSNKGLPEKEFKKLMRDLGISEAEADALFDQIDKDGNGLISEEEFQNMMGVDENELVDRALDKWGNAPGVVKATDKDGDGFVTEQELKQMMHELGLTAPNIKELTEELMKKYDTDHDGKLTAEQFEKIMRASADDLKERIQEKLGSAKEAMKKWDKDGDGKISKKEFLEGAKDMGISEKAAEAIWKEQSGGKDYMTSDDFGDIFGVGPDDLLERCFQHFGNPKKAFENIDTNQDGLISEAEWKVALKKLGLNADQAARLWEGMDTNSGERTKGYVSKWEFFSYMEWEELLPQTWDDGFGDIDPWGLEHKKFNELRIPEGHTLRGAVNLAGREGKILAAPKTLPEARRHRPGTKEEATLLHSLGVE